MPYHCYIIYSQKLDRFYVGHTQGLDERLLQHNEGKSKYTSKATDWKLVLSETFPTRDLAHKRERQIKSKKSRRYIEWLIESQK